MKDVGEIITEGELQAIYRTENYLGLGSELSQLSYAFSGRDKPARPGSLVVGSHNFGRRNLDVIKRA